MGMCLVGAAVATAATNEAPSPDAADVATNGVAVCAPATNGAPPSRTGRLDDFHDRTYERLNRDTKRFDRQFIADPREALDTPDMRLHLGLFGQVTYDDGVDWRVDPDFDADVALPNLEHRLHLFVRSADLAELPGTDPTDRGRALFAGLRHFVKAVDVDSSLGLRVKWVPSAFARLDWRPDWRAGAWALHPRQRVFYDTEEGFGELTSFGANRWLWRRTYVDEVSAVRVTQSTVGGEWEQTLILGRVHEYLEKKNEGRIVDTDEQARGYALRASVFGHVDAGWFIDRYRLTLIYRRHIHGKWMYLEIAPGADWLRDQDWRTVPNIRVGLDCLFWGPADRS